MTAILGIMVMCAVFGTVAWITTVKDTFNKKTGKSYIVWVLLLGFIVRIIAAASYKGHETDMGCFSAWADMAFGNGLSQFYLSDSFHDYPPGYLYVLYIIGAVKSLFNLQGELLWVVLKLPSILADLSLGYMAYNLTAKRFSKTSATAVAVFLVFNPVVILNSSVWGQVDSVLALFCVMSIYFASEHKLGASFFAFVAALLIKPQALFFSPVLLFGVIDEFYLSDEFDSKKFIKTILMGLGAVAAMLILFMPFGRTPIEGISVIINQYIDTVGQYKYMTVNAFNLYGVFGENWTELTPAIEMIGYTFIVAMVVFSGFVFFRGKDSSKYYLSSFILVFGIYMLAPKMHERYAFPGVFMLIMFVASMPTDKNVLMYGLFSLSQFFNIAWVLFVYEKDAGMYYKSPIISDASIINLALFIWCMYTSWQAVSDGDKSAKVPSAKIYMKKPFRLSEKPQKLVLFDICTILVITAVYGAVAFYKLGDKYAPKTETELCQNSIQVDLGREQEISKTAFFLGARDINESRNLTFSYFDNDGTAVSEDVITDGSVFHWEIRENHVTARYVIISTNCMGSDTDFSDRLYLKEVCFLNSAGDIITPVNLTDGGVRELFDEQDYLDTTNSYMSGTYFDEIYHPRTAYEFIHHMSIYETTHPPLGKVLMGIGILIFGMVPFGWRFMGTLLGVVMVPVVYIFAKRMFKNKWLAVLACVLFTFDFMHFTQTRLATIDTYVTLFIMLMYYYMYKYYTQSFYDRPLYKTLIPLGICGIFFGLSVASKWTGLYAGVGLAIIFFISLFERWREYRYAVMLPDSETDGISHKAVIASFKKNTVITLIFCCVMFIAVPFAIYTLSYIPYMNTPSGEGFKTIFANAEYMLKYHGKDVVSSTHPFSSYWFEWPIMYRPIWYYSNSLDNGIRQGISAFGNPAVWWVGIGAVAYCLAHTIIIPLRNKNYFGHNKNVFAVLYAVFAVIICVITYIIGNSNDNLVRMFPSVLMGVVMFVGVFAIVITNDDKMAQTSNRIPLFLLIGYFSSYMPWMLVIRTTYIYHYFPCVIFVVLMIVYSIKCIYENADNKRAVIISAVVYGVIAVGLFVMFYPVISGQPVNVDFVNKYLRWFESWVLVAQ